MGQASVVEASTDAAPMLRDPGCLCAPQARDTVPLKGDQIAWVLNHFEFQQSKAAVFISAHKWECTRLSHLVLGRGVLHAFSRVFRNSENLCLL